MSSHKLRPEFLIKDTQELRSFFAETHEIAVKKCLDHLDKHARTFVERSPFLCIGTQSPDGQADVSPRGDPPGLVKNQNDKTLLIPDRPGNNRLDTLTNLLANPAIGLLFIVPGFDDTMRINGEARLTRDPSLLAMMAVNDRTPTVAIAVTVNEVFIHCAKAFRRWRVWDNTLHQDRKDIPSLIQIVMEQTDGLPDDMEERDKMDADLEREYRKTMY